MARDPVNAAIVTFPSFFKTSYRADFEAGVTVIVSTFAVMPLLVVTTAWPDSREMLEPSYFKLELLGISTVFPLELRETGTLVAETISPLSTAALRLTAAPFSIAGPLARRIAPFVSAIIIVAGNKTDIAKPTTL